MLSSPRLAVVILAPYGPFRIEQILYCLRKQTIADHLQVLAVLPEGEDSGLSLSCFHSTSKVIQIEGFEGSGPPKAAAVKQAEAPIVAFAEDHCYPEPDWAEALLAAHSESHAAVSPWMGSANPENVFSMASFFNFLPSHSQRRGLRSSLPTHNSSYKTEALRLFDDDLGELLEMETAHLVPELLNLGWTVLHEPAARVWHVNVEKVLPFIREQFYGGRHYGAIRSRGWSKLRKLVYGLGSPLIPFLRLYRVGSDIVLHIRPAHRPMVLVGFFINALGEAWGYLAGNGDTSKQRLDLECWRERHTLRPYLASEIVPQLRLDGSVSQGR